jgi:hypothetical protein
METKITGEIYGDITLAVDLEIDASGAVALVARRWQGEGYVPSFSDVSVFRLLA